MAVALQQSTDGYLFHSVSGRSQFEHREVMERLLGRSLRPDEHVHHLNGNKTDNRPCNLFVASPSQHASFHRRGYVYLDRDTKELRYVAPTTMSVWGDKGVPPMYVTRHFNHYVKLKLKDLDRKRRGIGRRPPPRD